MIHAFHLAKLSYHNDKKSYRIFGLLLFACFTAIFLLILLVNGYVELENSYKTDDVSLREIQMWGGDANCGEVSFDEKRNQTIAGLSGVEDASQYFNIELQDGYTVCMDNQTLHCLPYVRGVNRHFSFASKSEIQRRGASPILVGRNVIDSGSREALIDENMCYLLDYDTPQRALGQKIKVIFSDREIDDIEIVGVFRAEFGDYGYRLTDMDRFSRVAELGSVQSNPFYFSDGLLQEMISSNDVFDWQYENLIVLCDSTDRVKNICDYAQSICGYSSISRIDTIETKAERVRSISVFLILLISIVLMIAIVVILDSLSVKIIHQRSFTEMLLKIGFRRKEIIGSYVLQNVFATIKAGCISGVVAFFCGIGVDCFFQGIYQEISEKTKYVFILDVPSSLAIVGALCILIGVATWIEAMVQVTRAETGWGLRHE